MPLLFYLVLSALLALASAQPASAAVPVASFSSSPSAPLTLEPVNFTSTSVGDVTSQSWDLDGDGLFDDAEGSSASRSFPTAGVYSVGLHVVGPEGRGDQIQNITVANRPPTASIAVLPSAPLAGDAVNFVSTSQDPDGTVVSQTWDLDNDGSYNDASGDLASRAFPSPGLYTVGLHIVDSDRAEVTATQTVAVAERPPEFVSPFPVIRLAGRATSTGIRVTKLTIEAPPGSRVEVRCRGRGCPREPQTRIAANRRGPHARISRLLRFRRFQHRLRARAVLEIFVTKPGAIGKYTRFTIRRGKPPRRQDLCLLPGAAQPSRCPSS